MKGKEARNAIYFERLDLSKSRTKEDELKSVNNVEKIDLTNGSQFAFLCKHFR